MINGIVPQYTQRILNTLIYLLKIQCAMRTILSKLNVADTCMNINILRKVEVIYSKETQPHIYSEDILWQQKTDILKFSNFPMQE